MVSGQIQPTRLFFNKTSGNFQPCLWWQNCGVFNIMLQHCQLCLWCQNQLFIARHLFFFVFFGLFIRIERWQEMRRGRWAMTCSKGLQVRLDPWVVAARTKLLYMGHMFYLLSYWGAWNQVLLLRHWGISCRICVWFSCSMSDQSAVMFLMVYIDLSDPLLSKFQGTQQK